MSEKYSGIYQIINLTNMKVYVGSAVDFIKRRGEHFNKLKRNVHHNIYLQNSYNKHGEDNFIFEILEFVKDNSVLLERENYYIELTDCTNPEKGYNICPKAGNCFGVYPSEETRKKMSLKSKGRPKSEETKKRMGEYQKTRIRSEEEKERARNLNVGRKFSEQAKKNMGDARIGIFAGSKNPNSKLTEEVVYSIKKMIYEGMRNVDIAKIIGVSHKYISSIRTGQAWGWLKYDPGN